MGEPVDDETLMSHWAGCEISHHGCAIARLDQVKAELAEAKAEIERLRATDDQAPQKRP